jgi:hypothetical protein
MVESDPRALDLSPHLMVTGRARRRAWTR